MYQSRLIRIDQLALATQSISPFLDCFPYFNSNLVNSRPNEVKIKFTSTRYLHTGKPTQLPTRDKLDLSFNNAEQAFKSKTTGEILRAYIVFKLCQVNYLVENADKLNKIGQKYLGKKLFEKVMKMTFYGHFVAGADHASCEPQVRRMKEFGVKAILDYSAEEDLDEEEVEKCEIQSFTPISGARTPEESYKKYHHQSACGTRQNKSIARTFFYMGEAHCEKNTEIILNCIDAVSKVTKGAGFAAIKITALGRPQLLMQLSEAIAKIHRYVGAITGKKGRVSEQGVTLDDFKLRLDKKNALGDTAVQAWLDGMTYDDSGLLHIIPWKNLIEAQKEMSDSLKVFDMTTGKMENLVPPLTAQEEEMFRNMMARLHTIFKFAAEKNVRVLVDAEQSYMQPAISRLTLEMMRKYNKERPTVFNTYQCYLNKTHSYLFTDMGQAERQNFFFGAKLVRGAYMEQERLRAQTVGYKDPILPNFDATTDMLHSCLEEGMLRMKKSKAENKPIRICLMAATHNEDTIRFVIKKMKEHGIKRSDRAINFGQLYGMCDQVSFSLGQAGYSVYKYCPYGPVLEVMPYLSRRAIENRSLVGSTKKEQKLLRKEFIRRILTGKWFYRPKGGYESASA